MISHSIMSLTREIRMINEFNFQKTIRVIFSGSSQSGKTFLIGKMLERQVQLFGDEFDMVLLIFMKPWIRQYVMKVDFQLKNLSNRCQGIRL